ncbi:hypothetical protein LTR10_017445 [Elasticomyces elasticus]|uniref:DUF1275 domain protein n=1 Tax=Exophiala sideris TaxID=1016849 RepID=A0ABR0JC79_9EURO|nr:hypothetical protein LTR10_017445 [Elasticomyces elasticus]KAK5030373.1 hypothetical protein LTS07_005157 [Exophiala sideris]KAK5038426.1 hypothetical protein LTR13_004173 [Exophiala sideris]KAK5060309.1 hypothetical protein LTR69_005626 [Exophiala sideris]KAK5183220.1 hypothetical protein LTR44_004221 [Eurotiomycetes sp. CCFEE 6388]
MATVENVVVLSSDEPPVHTSQKTAADSPMQTEVGRPQKSNSGSFVNRLRRHLSSPIKVTIFAEIELLILTFCTGIQDVTTFPDYHCFASNQTGNTVMLAMAVLLPDVTHKLFVTANIGMSLGCFLLGGYVTGQLSHIIGARSRAWIVFCNFFQTGLVFIAVALQYTQGVHVEGSHTVIVIGLLAFASGSQVVLSRSLAMTEISTAMATAAWVDLLIDKNLLAVHNRPRTRRASFLAALVAGGFFGAYIYREVGSAFAILISAVGKLIVTVLFLFNGMEKSQGNTNIV